MTREPTAPRAGTGSSGSGPSRDPSSDASASLGSERELQHLFERCVAPDLLAGAEPASQPVAMIVAGQPGAGLTYATIQLRKQLIQTVTTAAHVSTHRLLAYHPLWAAGGDIAPALAFALTRQTQVWYDRMVDEVQKRRLNLVAEVETMDGTAVQKLATQLRRDGYIVQAVFIAKNREESRLAMMARYEMRRSAGLAAEQPSIPNHELAFDNVRALIASLEERRTVDGLRVIDHAGAQIYESRVINGALDREPRALATLDAALERPRSPKELVQLAMRWETLVQRLASDPAVPRDTASQTVTWRNAAVARCERDTVAAQMLQWAREAAMFRVMNRFEFEKEFPHLSRAVKSLGLAVIEAEKFGGEEGQRLLFHARENIAQRIERGDFPRIAAREKAMEEKALTKVQAQGRDGAIEPAPEPTQPARDLKEREPPSR